MSGQFSVFAHLFPGAFNDWHVGNSNTGMLRDQALARAGEDTLTPSLCCSLFIIRFWTLATKDCAKV